LGRFVRLLLISQQHVLLYPLGVLALLLAVCYLHEGVPVAHGRILYLLILKVLHDGRLLQKLLLVILISLLLDVGRFREGLLQLGIVLYVVLMLGLRDMRSYCLLLVELAHQQRGVVVLGGRSTDEVVLLHTVAKEIEVLALRFLL
jgi:hypothetical protein